MQRLVLAACVLTALPAAALAADRRVPKDYATIQAAVDAADANDRILIARGTYFENVVATKDGLSFVGTRVILDGTSLTGTQGVALEITGANATVQGITFRNGSTQLKVTGDGASVRKCTFRNANNYGVEIVGNDAVLDRITVSGPNSDCASITGNDAAITASRAVNSGDGGFYVSGTGARVERCIVQNMVDDPAIEVSGSGATVSKNRINNVDDHGIEVTGDDATVTLNRVSSISDEGSGIHLDGDDAHVEKNTILAIYGYGIRVRGGGASILSNRIADQMSEYHGIYLHSSVMSAGGLIEGNIVSDGTEDGIYVSVPNVTVRRNVVQRTGGEDDRAYYFGASGIVAEDNSAIDCDDTGFEINADDVTLRRCKSVNSTAYGFYVASGRSGVEIDGCSATNSDLAGIVNYGASTVLKNSKFSGNRRDVTNDGTYAEFTGNKFATGGDDVQLFDPGMAP